MEEITYYEVQPEQVASNNSVRSEDYKNIQSNLSQFFSAGDDCHRPLNQQTRYLFFETRRDNSEYVDEFDQGDSVYILDFYYHAIAYFGTDDDEIEKCNQTQQENEFSELIFDCINSHRDQGESPNLITQDDIQAVIALEPEQYEFHFYQEAIPLTSRVPSENIINSVSNRDRNIVPDQMNLSNLPLCSSFDPLVQIVQSGNQFNCVIQYITYDEEEITQKNKKILENYKIQFPKLTDIKKASFDERMIILYDANSIYSCKILKINNINYHQLRIMQYLDVT